MRRLPFILLVTLGVLAACDNNQGITVNFVGNSTCDTANQSPYSPSPPNTNSAPVGKPIDEMPHLHVVQVHGELPVRGHDRRVDRLAGQVRM